MQSMMERNAALDAQLRAREDDLRSLASRVDRTVERATAATQGQAGMADKLAAQARKDFGCCKGRFMCLD
jgi:hypothetical protein